MYKVGQILKEHATYHGSAAIAVQDGFITLFMCYQKPYLKELSSFKKKKFEIRVRSYGSVINFSFHFEDGEYNDMCYNPYLSPFIHTSMFRDEITHFLMLFIDAATGRIKAIRYQELTSKFSNHLADLIEKEQSKRFLVLDSYNQEVEEVWYQYSSQQLFENASENSCLITDWIIVDSVMTLDDL